MSRRQLRPWQRFLILADEDLLAFALLYEGRSMGRAYYFAGQAVEKYLKALVLKERQRRKESVAISKKKNPWLFTHNLRRYAEMCREVDPKFYGAKSTKRDLRRIRKFDMLARYPARKWSFSSGEIPMIERFTRQIRRDLRLGRDYYPLAKGLNATRELAAAGYTLDEAHAYLRNLAVPPWATGALALRRLFDAPDSLLSGLDQEMSQPKPGND